MFNHFRFFSEKLYVAPIHIIYPNRSLYDYNDLHLFYDFGCYKLTKNFCYF